MQTLVLATLTTIILNNYQTMKLCSTHSNFNYLNLGKLSKQAEAGLDQDPPRILLIFVLFFHLSCPLLFEVQ